MIGANIALERTLRVTLDRAQRAELSALADRIVRSAGAEILTRVREWLDVVNELEDGRFDPVTEADRRCEEVIRAAVDAEFPAHGISVRSSAIARGTG